MDRLSARVAGRLLSYGLPLLYLMTSIAFYLHTYDSAQVKITIVQMGGIVLVGLLYVTLICEKDMPWRRYWMVMLPLLAALASGVVSFLHADYQGPSLDEFLRRVFYIHFALIALKEINTVERLRRMVLALLVAVAVAAIYGFIQFIDIQFFPTPTPGIDPFVWRQAFGIKIFSTFGNPNFFGNFLVILAPITLALLLKRYSENSGRVILFGISAMGVSAFLWHTDLFAAWAHIDSWTSTLFVLALIGFSFYAVVQFSFLGLLFFLITLCVVVTESKGSWIGYTASFVSFLMLVLFYFSQFKSEKAQKTLRRAAIVLLVVCTAAVGAYSRMRITSIRFRICTWVSTFEMAFMHPVWGNGVGSFRVLYPAFRRPQIFHIEGKHNTETDHAENEYWEVFQDEGLIGLGIFLWFISTFSVLGVRSLRRFTESSTIRDPVTGNRKTLSDPRAYYMLGVLAAFWGMLMHNFMDVSLRFVSSGIFLWLLAGLIGAMVVHDPMAETDAQRDARELPVEPVQGHHPAMLVACAILTVVIFARLTYIVTSQFFDAQGPFPAPFGEQLLWFIAGVSFLGILAGFWYALYKLGRSFKYVYGYIVLCLVVAYPLEIFWGYFMADVHHNRGIYFSKQGKWEEAISNYREVVKLNPNYIMAYYFMGNVYTDRWGPGDVDLAMKEYQRVWRIAPNYVQSHHQAGLVYLKKGEEERNQYRVLVTQGKLLEAQAMLAQVKADWEQSLAFFRKYHSLDPVFEPNYARAGWVHMQLAELAQIQGHPEDAMKHYIHAESLYDESLQALVCRSSENDVLHEKWDRSHRHFSADMFENLGNVRFIRNNLVAAEHAYRMSLWAKPDNIRAMKNLAAVVSRLGRQNETIALWHRIRQIAPQDLDVQRVFHVQPAPRPS